MGATKRHAGIELFRIVSMFMVVIIHALGRYGVLASLEPYPLGFSFVQGIQIAVMCAVNCFALISGYVGLYSTFRASRIISVWLNTLFWCICIFSVFVILGKTSVNYETLVLYLFPVSTSTYWYITAYVGMSIFAPLMNTAVINTEKKKLTSFFMVILLMFSVLLTVFKVDAFRLYEGYSALWICVVYMFGAYMRKYDIPSLIKHSTAFTVFIISTLLTLGLKLYITPIIRREFIYYTSPFIILNAIMLLCIFVKIDVKNEKLKKIICFISPSALGVYLIHTHPCFWNELKNSLAFLSEKPFIILLLGVFGFSLAIYVACTGLELLRIGLFKVCGVNRFLAWFDKKAAKFSL